MNKLLHEKIYPAAMTVAGSDSSGGAGIQTDLRAFAAFGVYGTSAITAITCQNPLRVDGIMPVPAETVAGQIRAVTDVCDIAAFKTGMLFSAEIIEAVAFELKGKSKNIVADPVMISTSEHRLIEKDAEDALKKYIFPIASWITPNIPEAETITNMRLKNNEDYLTAAKIMRDTYGCGVILKGGHAGGDTASDLVFMPDGTFFTLSAKRLEVPNFTLTHGTGCAFSAALAANLALGVPPEKAAENAKKFISSSIENGVKLGRDVYSMYPERMRIK